MSMNRRSFMQSILALGMAPAVVRAESLMRTFVRRESGLVVPEWVTGDRLGFALDRTGPMFLYKNGVLLGGQPIPPTGIYWTDMMDMVRANMAQSFPGGKYQEIVIDLPAA